MINHFEIYIALLGLAVFIGLLFKKTSIPAPLLLVIAGMLLSLLPNIPRVELHPALVLNIFLPMLIYPASAQFSWRDVKTNLRPILLLSIGHVLFITLLVAVVAHMLIPNLGWARAIILGAVVSPPDDVAILAIAEKLNLPNRIFTILTGESLLNDATALVLFRFALAALLTNQFSPLTAVSNFFIIIVCETAYGFILGHLIGQLRLRIEDPILHVMVSFLTPFLAYLPAEQLGGCGVLATVVTGLVIGHRYLDRFSPEARLLGRSFWATIVFALQSILFLLVGLDFHFTLQGISLIPLKNLFEYGALIVLVVIVGRFLWVFSGTYLPRLLFPSIRKKEPLPPWQQPFIISWAGMRGGISLAAALALPILPTQINGTNPRDLLIYLVFCVITATLLVQGLTLQWLLKALGLNAYGNREKYGEHLSELMARETMMKAVVSWLLQYKKEIKGNPCLVDRIDLRMREYQIRKNQLKETIKNHDGTSEHDEQAEQQEATLLASQINEVERDALAKLWQEKKISHAIRTKLLQQLDYHSKHITG